MNIIVIFVFLPFLILQNEDSCCKCGQTGEKSRALICFNADDMRKHVEHFEPLKPPGLHRRLNLSGLVEMEVRYGPTGDIECVKTISGHPVAISAMMESIKKWKFKLVRVNDFPTSCCGRIEVEYSFRNGISSSRIR